MASPHDWSRVGGVTVTQGMTVGDGEFRSVVRYVLRRIAAAVCRSRYTALILAAADSQIEACIAVWDWHDAPLNNDTMLT